MQLNCALGLDVMIITRRIALLKGAQNGCHSNGDQSEFSDHRRSWQENGHAHDLGHPSVSIKLAANVTQAEDIWREKRNSDELTLETDYPRFRHRTMELREYRNLKYSSGPLKRSVNGSRTNDNRRTKRNSDAFTPSTECPEFHYKTMVSEPELKLQRVDLGGNSSITTPTTDNDNVTKKISFSHRREAKGDLARRVVSIIQGLPKNSKLDKLKMRNCDTTGEDLGIIHEGSVKKEIKIATLNFSGNKNINLRVVDKLRKLFRSDTLDLSETELDAKQIKYLEKIQVTNLVLNYKAFDHESITTALTSLITNCLKELSLVDSRITDEQLLTTAQNASTKIPLEKLNLSHVTLGEKGVTAVATLVNKTNGMEMLVLSDCDLSAKSLKNLQTSIQKTILILDVSSNPDITKGDVKTLAAIASKVKCTELDISSNGLTDQHLTQLVASPADVATVKVQRLSICETPQASVVSIATLVIAWDIQDLDASECSFTSEEINDLASLLEKRKLQKIDVSDSNEIISKRKEEALKQLRKRCLKHVCKE